jgi:hypothetical protein
MRLKSNINFRKYVSYSAALVWNEALLDYLLEQNMLLLNQMALYELQTTLSKKV